MNILLLLILITYQTVESLLSMKDVKSYKDIEVTEKVKIGFYKSSIFWGWIPVIIILLFVIFTPIRLEDIGLRKIHLSEYMWLNILSIIVSIGMAVILLYQAVMYLFSEKYRKELALQIEEQQENKNHYDDVTLNIVIPRTMKEKICFFFVSLTAGICEEIHIRGCLIYLFSVIFPSLPIAVAGLLTCILFGFYHCYQGLQGIIKTGAISVLFVCLYMATDSIIPGIVLHFWCDFSSAFIVRDKVKL